MRNHLQCTLAATGMLAMVGMGNAGFAAPAGEGASITLAQAQQPTTPSPTNTPGQMMEHGQGMGGMGRGMGQQMMEHGQGMGEMGKGMGPMGAGSTGRGSAPSGNAAPPAGSSCPAGTTLQMDANGQHSCK